MLNRGDCFAEIGSEWAKLVGCVDVTRNLVHQLPGLIENVPCLAQLRVGVAVKALGNSDRVIGGSKKPVTSVVNGKDCLA